MLLSKIKQNIDTHFPEMYNSQLLLAVSGGIDSMVMLDVLHKLNFNITVAHCNFKLRGAESDAETVFLEQYLKLKGIPFQIIFFDTELYAAEAKLSIQLAARKLRYDWFYKLLNNGLDYIITAHHLDDQVETFLINLTRGTGTEGLLGIPPKNDKILRPFLGVSRDEILEYAKYNHIEWRDDSSNNSTKYFRNKIRHKVVPVLKELNTDFLNTFSNTITHLNQFHAGYLDGFDVLKNQIVKKEEDTFYINVNALNSLKAPQAFLYQFLKDFGFTAWNDIYNLVDALSGKTIYSATHVLLKNRDFLLLKPFSDLTEQYFIINEIHDFNTLPFHIFVKNNHDAVVKNKNEVILDAEMLNFPLIVRKWQEGDYFYPFGMNGKKKLSKYFKDEKFSQFQKQEIWLLVQNNNVDIIWVMGQRADNRFIAKNNSNNTLYLKI
jgi:tRNA(Ile)-lysidine synthase